MYKLVIDTSSRICQIAIVDDHHIISHVFQEMSFGIGNSFFDIMKQAFQKSTLKKKDIGEIYVTLGPGSFTGVRIGIAAAIGLKLGLKIPVFGISSFKAHAMQKQNTLPTLVILDAKRVDFYLQEFDQNSNTVSSPLNISLETLCQMFQDKEYFICGDYVQDIKTPKWVMDQNRFLDPLIITKTPPEDGLVPLYVRPPDVGIPKNKMEK